MDDPRPIDPERLKEFAKRVFGTLQGAVTAGMIHLGDRLGLYRALAEAPATSARARRAHRPPRALGARVAAPAGRRGPARVRRRASASRSRPRAARCSPTSSTRPSAAALFSQLPQTMAILERLPRGLPHRRRPALRRLRARGRARHRARLRALVPDLPGAASRSPSLDGVKERSSAARGSPTSAAAAASRCSSWRRPSRAREFHGYDLSQHAIARAERNRAEAGARERRASTTPAARRCPPTGASTSCSPSTASTT